MVFESDVFDLTKSPSKLRGKVNLGSLFRGSEMYLGSHESLFKGDLPVT